LSSQLRTRFTRLFSDDLGNPSPYGTLRSAISAILYLFDFLSNCIFVFIYMCVIILVPLDLYQLATVKRGIMRRWISITIILSILLVPILFGTQGVKATLQGSLASRKSANVRSDIEGLSRIKNDTQLAKFKKAFLLVRLPETASVRVDSHLAIKWRWCRPWTRSFLQDLAKLHYSNFRKPYIITSGVRTVFHQIELMKRNRNAVTPYGSYASSHLRGNSIDITKIGMSNKELKWFRTTLLQLESLGKIDATEEYGQEVFHIVVFKSYIAKRVSSVSTTKKKK
jgi:hypothetical protein